MSDARKAIETLRALKPDVPTEEPWTPGGMGIYGRAGKNGYETITDRGAQADWVDNNDPRQLMELLRAGLADAESQRVAADIIARAAKGLPKPNATRAAREHRNQWIAWRIHLLLQDGARPGAAERELAKEFGVGVETIRKIWARPAMREFAAQVEMLGKKHMSNYQDSDWNIV